MSWATTRQMKSPKVRYGTRSIEELPVQQLSNGAMGIDFIGLSKPPNLANSAVLRMLEEEEKELKRRGAGARRVVWPPPQHSFDEYMIMDQPAPPQQQQQQTINNTNHHQLEPQTQVNNNHVEPSQQTYFRPVFTPPPTTISLRESAPIRQPSPPVYTSQPVTQTIQGGFRSRGDQKWPPPGYKEQAKEENAARVALAKGPLFRPKRVQKDYSSFFSQNVLPSTYPGYKAPPGTQHYYEYQGYNGNGMSPQQQQQQLYYEQPSNNYY